MTYTPIPIVLYPDCKETEEQILQLVADTAINCQYLNVEEENNE